MPAVRCALPARGGPSTPASGSLAGVPRCDCGEPLKPDVVLFGEYLPERALERAQQLAASADLLLCVGSSLEVYPVAQLPAVTLSQGGQVAILTQGPTPFDSRATVKLSGDVVAELEEVLAQVTRTRTPAPATLPRSGQA